MAKSLTSLVFHLSDLTSLDLNPAHCNIWDSLKFCPDMILDLCLNMRWQLTNENQACDYMWFKGNLELGPTWPSNIDLWDFFFVSDLKGLFMDIG